MGKADVTVATYLEGIIETLRKESGYPYPEGHIEPDGSRPFAYGLAMGTLMSLKVEWERRMNG